MTEIIALVWWDFATQTRRYAVLLIGPEPKVLASGDDRGTNFDSAAAELARIREWTGISVDCVQVLDAPLTRP